jgi:hypothetical protein
MSVLSLGSAQALDEGSLLTGHMHATDKPNML